MLQVRKFKGISKGSQAVLQVRDHRTSIIQRIKALRAVCVRVLHNKTALVKTGPVLFREEKDLRPQNDEIPAGSPAAGGLAECRLAG